MSDGWKGKRLDKPSLDAWKTDRSLLEGQPFDESKAYLTCYDPSTAVSTIGPPRRPSGTTNGITFLRPVAYLDLPLVVR